VPRVCGPEGPAPRHGLEIRGTSTCTECQAVNPPGVHYCVECGASLDVDDSVPASRAGPRLRHEAAAALKAAYREIGIVRVAYRFGGVAYAVATVFAVFALADVEVPVRPGLLVVGLTSLLSALLFMGAIHILFQPFVWTLTIAVWASVISVVHFVGPNPYGVASWASAAWAVLAWCTLIPTFRFRRLVEKHKDLYITHHASSRTLRSLKGRSAHERHERLLAAMQRAARRAWKVSTLAGASIVLVGFVGSWVTLAYLRPERLEDVRVRFEAAWQSSDLDAVEDLFDARVRAVEQARLVGKVDGHEWRDALPSLSGGRSSGEDGERTVTYELAGVDDATLRVHWLQAEGAWRIERLELPVPPFEPVLAAFVEAWRASDPEAIASFFAPDSRAEMRDSIASAAEGRGWTAFPDLPEPRLTLPTEGRARAVFRVGRGELETEWHYRIEGRWVLHVLRMPRWVRER